MNHRELRERFFKILKANPGGISQVDVAQQIVRENPDTRYGSIFFMLDDVIRKNSDQVERVNDLLVQREGPHPVPQPMYSGVDYENGQEYDVYGRRGYGRGRSFDTDFLRPMSQYKTMTDLALEVLDENPGGLRYMDFFRILHKQLPRANSQAILNVIHKLPVNFPNMVSRPERGFYILTKNLGQHVPGSRPAIPTIQRPRTFPAAPINNGPIDVDTMDNSIFSLLQLGFAEAGEWQKSFEDISPLLHVHALSASAHFAFVIEGEVKFISHCEGNLKYHLRSFQRPACEMLGLKSLNDKIWEAISSGQRVFIYVRPHGTEEAEETLVNAFLKMGPEWNPQD